MSEDNQFDLDSFEPSFLEDGGGISGEASQRYGPFVEDTTEYHIDPEQELAVESDTILPDTGDENPFAACAASAGDPPAMGTYVLGSVNGVCQWINTTTCS